MKKISPDQLAAPGTELAIQTALFAHIADAIILGHPDAELLRWVQAIPLGGERNPAVASRMKMSGVKKGMFDIIMPFPRGEWYCGWVELKKPEYQNRHQGGLSDEQVAFGEFAAGQGAYCRAAYSWRGAWAAIAAYLAAGPRLGRSGAGPMPPS